MKVVSVSSQFANGKDVLVNHLLERLDDWERVSFAQSVKDIFCDAFGVDNEFIEEWKRKPECPEGFMQPVRQSLQFIGDGFRQIRPNIWIEIAFRRMNKPSIISDGRYFNEAIHTKKNGGINILMWRKGFENDDPNPSESQMWPVIKWFKELYTESGMEGDVWKEIKCPSSLPEAAYYDLFIANDGTLDSLYNKADQIVIPYIRDFYARSSI